MFMTLLAGLAVQWTGTQQIVFVWAGAMHLLSLALFWFWFKGRFTQVNVDAGLDMSGGASGTGIVGGLAVLAVGIVLLVYVSQHWDYIVSIVKIHRRACRPRLPRGGFVNHRGRVAVRGHVRRRRRCQSDGVSAGAISSSE